MNATAAAGAAILEKLKELLGDRFNEVLELPLTEVPNEILEYIRNNPGQTAFYVANGAIFFCPALLTGPLLNALGFTFIGPRFGKYLRNSDEQNFELTRMCSCNCVYSPEDIWHHMVVPCSS